MTGPRTAFAPPSVTAGSPEAVLRRLELTVGRRLDGLLQGDYRGLVPGHGSEAGETRLYTAGDDVRRIDWNVTARMQQPHVRETIADRELETWLLVDLSPSTDFGTALCTKRDLAVAAAGAVAFLTGRSGNRVGAQLLTVDGIETVPARSGDMHVRALMHKVIAAPRGDGGGTTDLEAGLRRLASLTTRRGLAVVVSDFITDSPLDPPWRNTLRMVVARHETLVVEVIDPRELELPDVGLMIVVDPETGDTREVDTGSAELRRRYAEGARAQREGIARALRSVGADHLVLRTDRDWLIDLVRFVALRRRRIDHLRRARAEAGQ
ncbi:MAG TPA: DUF58 domain-containing protein [Acidimicrobiales bacterium]